MLFCRLIKPSWGRATFDNGESNPDFKREIQGLDVIEGANFSKDFLLEKNRQGYNIYFFPNHPSKDVYADGLRYMNGSVIDVFNYIFLDMDLKDGVYASKEEFFERLSKFPVKPTMVVDSGNGVHAYWRMSGLTKKSFILGQFALINEFKTDQSVWTVLQLMRMPGFYNTKRLDNLIKADINRELSSNKTYTFKDFPKEFLESITPQQLEKAQRHIDRSEGKLDIDLGDIDVNEIPEKFTELLETNEKINQLFNNPQGDRSNQDMSLANHLFNHKFTYQEAVAIISNTQKARSKGSHRVEYAQLTVSKVYSDRPKNKLETVSDYLKRSENQILKPVVNGTKYLDYGVLGNPWRKGQLLGIIGGSGVGKTAKALNILQDIIFNNPDNDDVYVFFSLEMPKGEIIEKWVNMVGYDSPLANRLYVKEAQTDDEMPEPIGLQEIYNFCTEVKQVTGKPIGAIVVDHFHIISTHINPAVKPDFGVNSEQGTGWGENRNLSLNLMATQLKNLIKSLDTFGIILSQTTKEKGVGDQPIAKDGSYGASQFEWIMDRIITIWQPLMRVQNQTHLRFLAWQYAKIRHKHKKDKVQEYQPYLLTYDMDTGKLKPSTPEEFAVFMDLKPQADEIRKSLSKKEFDNYAIQKVSMDQVLKAINGGV